MRLDRNTLAYDGRWRATAPQAIVAKFPNAINSREVMDDKDMASIFATALRQTVVWLHFLDARRMPQLDVSVSRHRLRIAFERRGISGKSVWGETTCQA